MESGFSDPLSSLLYAKALLPHFTQVPFLSFRQRSLSPMASSAEAPWRQRPNLPIGSPRTSKHRLDLAQWPHMLISPFWRPCQHWPGRMGKDMQIWNESFSSIAPSCIMKKVTEKQKGVKCIYFKRVWFFKKYYVLPVHKITPYKMLQLHFFAFWDH